MPSPILDRPAVLVEIAKRIAAQDPEFQTVRGPGEGDRATAAYLCQIRNEATEKFGEDLSERKICGKSALAVDFYFEREKTIVEVALGLPNPTTEFEKDILKALMAQESGYSVERLIFISRPGGATKCAQPGRAAFRAWAMAKHALEIHVYDLQGDRRVRHRKKGSKGLIDSA